MKKLFYIIVSVFLLSAAYSCGEDYSPSLSVLPGGPVIFTSDGGSVQVTVTTGFDSWDAVSTQSWCAVEKTGWGFFINAAPYYGNESLPDAVIEVTAGTARKNIVVKQGGAGYDLSATGTANSYIVTAPGKYNFDATVVGNGDAGIVDGAFHVSSAEMSPVSASLLWQDYYNKGNGRGLITSVSLSLDKTRVMFTTSDVFVPGNAVIAVYDAEGNILWSWHIWMPEQEVKGLNSVMGYSVMNMNLGATVNEIANPKSYGMLYQWGRKDPLPAAATLTGNATTVGATIYDIEGKELKIANSSWTSNTANTLIYSVRNPMVCLSSYSYYSQSRDWLAPGQSNDALWGNPNGHVRIGKDYPNKGVKSIYDPCPVGWRVPPADVFQNFTSSGAYAWADSEGNVPDFNIYDKNGDGKKSIEDYEYGWIFNIDEGVASYFPAAARFDGSYAMLMGSMSGLWGSYWGNTGHESSMGFNNMGYSVLSFQVKNMQGGTEITASPSGGSGRADAYSVRCIKE